MVDEDRKNEWQDIEQSHHGIFGAENAGLQPTLKDHDAVVAQVERDGLLLKFCCDGCGAETTLLVEWPELVALKYGLNPAHAFQNRPGIIAGRPMDWSYDTDEQRWKPHAQCRAKCRTFHYGVRLTPDEPERYLQQGRRARYINAAGEQQISTLCAQIAGAGAPR